MKVGRVLHATREIVYLNHDVRSPCVSHMLKTWDTTRIPINAYTK